MSAGRPGRLWSRGWSGSARVNWSFVKHLLTTSNKQSWMSGEFWAPEIHKVGDTWAAFWSARGTDGKRRVTSISEIVGTEGAVITMQEIFRFRQMGLNSDGIVQGRFEATGIRPKFIEQVTAHGISLSSDLFRPDAKFEQ